ncbi:MAG: agmatine deiminase family protein [Dysgonamonadaceae bacterium]|nr:agmatine deiminase family protein [Dysgonamonadaceae bacterium]
MTSIQFPAEWYPQSAIQITWPHKNSDWTDILDEITQCYIELSKEIVKRTKLLIVCADRKEVEKYFTVAEQTQLILTEIESNDTWARDHGAISVFIGGKPVIYDFGFNGWGLKFAANYDNQITGKLFEKNIFSPDVSYHNHLNFILEGGAIESDGNGTLLTTSNCLLAPNRNEPLSKEDIENQLIKLFGLKRILWLNHGYLAGDDTDNHIDTLARFCNETTIAYVQCTDIDDEHYEELQKMEEELRMFRTLRDEPYNLIPLPMAEPIYDHDYRLPATYANFLIMSSAVLMPTYSTATDSVAKEQLQKAFPNKEIVSIDCRVIIKQHGSLHCITMQYPEGFL